MIATPNATAATRDSASNVVSGIDVGLLVVRVGFGAPLAVHGSQKLFGWFSGAGLDEAAQAFQDWGYDPGKFFATLAGLTEIFGGLLLSLGLLTPLGAAIVVSIMVNAVYVNRGGSFDTWEAPVLYGLSAVALAFTGPGRLSLDHGRTWQRQGLVWGAGAVALGLAAAVITLVVK